MWLLISHSKHLWAHSFYSFRVGTLPNHGQTDEKAELIGRVCRSLHHDGGQRANLCGNADGELSYVTGWQSTDKALAMPP